MAERRRLKLPGQIIWKDGVGRTQMVPVETVDVSEFGVRVELRGSVRIPMYRLVYFHLERHLRTRADVPESLRHQNVLCAVFRVGPCSEQTGVPMDYGLRMLVEPKRGAARQAAWADVAPADCTRTA